MGAKSDIEWTDATWNPIVGCSVLTPGCTNCYAMRQAPRTDALSLGAPWVGNAGKLTKPSKAGPVWSGAIRFVERRLTEPLTWRKPRMIFVNSMGDLFHEDVPDEWILRVLDVIRRTSYDGGSNCGSIKGEHTYQVLTKRAARMASFMPRLRFNPLDDRGLYLSDDGKPSVVMKNLWLGVSTERQQEADQRIPHLLQTPAAARFISAEPLLGPIDLRNLPSVSGIGRYLDALTNDGAQFSDVPGKLDWVIVGGESGHGARPMNPRWLRDLRDQCSDAGVAFFFKQWGEFVSVSEVEGEGPHFTFPDGRTVRRVGKKAAGRLLDGIEHNAMPKVAA